MITTTTTPTIEGKAVLSYLGVVGAQVIFGAFFLKDIMADAVDVFGGRSSVYEDTFEQARSKALDELRQRARSLGGNAVLNVRFDYTVLGANNGMLMVAATGTAAVIAKSAEELAKDKKHADDDVPRWVLHIMGKDSGPFSVHQLRKLVCTGKVDPEQVIRTEDGSDQQRIKTLIT